MGDINSPNLVGTINHEPSEQIWIDLVFQMRFTGLGLRINGFETYQPHQPLNTATINFIAQSPVAQDKVTPS